MDTRRFKVFDPKGNNVLGGEVSRDNFHLLSIVGYLEHGKAIDDLDVGESAFYEFSASGVKGEYSILRTK